MAQQCQLWMGSLQPYMTENFILAAFRKMGKNTIKTFIKSQHKFFYLFGFIYLRDGPDNTQRTKR